MKDRVPLYPGRVKLVPVSGQENVYDMTRADQPTRAGDPLNKATLLKDATAALFGLGTDAVPDDVLAYVGKYAQHWWKRIKYEEDQVVFGEERAVYLYYDNLSTVSEYWEYSEGIDTSDPGDLKLVEPTSSVNLRYNDTTNASKLNGKYFKHGYTFASPEPPTPSDGIIFYAEPDAPTPAYGRESSGDRNYYMTIQGKEVSFSPAHTVGDWEYVMSPDKSEYPESGVKDGYLYVYIGIPFENLPAASKIATGSYVGTGLSGASNPNSLTFELEPKMIVIPASYGRYAFIFPTFGIGLSLSGSGANANLTVYKFGTTVNWYGDSGVIQLNNSGNTYNYIAIG